MSPSCGLSSQRQVTMATIGGVAFRLFDRLPKVGDKVTHDGYEFITQEVKGLRISKVQVQKISSRDLFKPEEPEPDGSGAQLPQQESETEAAEPQPDESVGERNNPAESEVGPGDNDSQTVERQSSERGEQ